MKTATLISAADAPRTTERLRRLRSLAWLLDNSIPLPGGYRIGLDPIIGLVPGLGDAIGALFSAFIINEARLLGAPRSIADAHDGQRCDRDGRRRNSRSRATSSTRRSKRTPATSRCSRTISSTRSAAGAAAASSSQVSRCCSPPSRVFVIAVPVLVIVALVKLF